MIEPSFTDLMKKVDSRYSLVIGVAKRARQLTSGEEPAVSCKNSKAVDIATCEVAEGKILLLNEYDSVDAEDSQHPETSESSSADGSASEPSEENSEQ